MEESDKTLVVFSISAFLNDIGSDIIKPLWPTFVTVFLGAPASVLGLLDGIGDSVASLSKFPAGVLADRHEKKPFIWSGYALGGLSRVGYALSSATWMLIPFRVADRAGKGLRDPARDAIVANTAKKGGRGRSFGVLRAVDSAGTVIGPLLALALFAYLGYQRLFMLAAIPSLLAAVLVLWFIKEQKTGSSRKQLMQLGKLDSNFRKFTLVSAIFALSWFSLSFMLLYAGKYTSIEMLPVLYLAFTVSSTVAAYPAGALSDRVGRKPLLAASYLLFGIVCAGFLFANSLAALFLLFVLYGVHFGMQDALQSTFVSDLAPKEIRASAIGTFQAVFGLCALPASLVAGILWDAVSPAATFGYGLVLSLASVLLFMVFVKENRNAF